MSTTSDLRTRGLTPEEAFTLANTGKLKIEADGVHHIVLCASHYTPLDTDAFHVELTGQLNGSIYAYGHKGQLNITRSGDGDGHAQLVFDGSGKVTRSGSGNGNALSISINPCVGRATRSGSGKGFAINYNSETREGAK